LRSASTVSVDRGRRLFGVGLGLRSDVPPTGERPHSPIVDLGVKDRDVALVVVGVSGERIRRSVEVADHLECLDGLLPDDDVNVVDEKEAAGKPLVDVGTRDRYRGVGDDMAIGAPPGHQCPETLDFRTWL